MEDKGKKIIIECPECEWQPFEDSLWQCSCGHKWNTFDTRGLCPNCNKQWEDTRCPACGSMPSHKSWYKDPSAPKQEESATITKLKIKKRKLEKRLIAYGIKNRRVKYLPYLDHSQEQFREPVETGIRMIILHAIAMAAHDLSERKLILKWLKQEKLSDKISPEELKFLKSWYPKKELRIELSWRYESALVLAWTLNLVPDLPALDIEISEAEMERFEAVIPQIGDETGSFLSKLSYRSLDEIYEENLLNEIATSYFRDLYLLAKKDETKINRMLSFERHRTLNWLRIFAGIDEWDETVTST